VVETSDELATWLLQWQTVQSVRFFSLDSIVGRSSTRVVRSAGKSDVICRSQRPFVTPSETARPPFASGPVSPVCQRKQCQCPDDRTGVTIDCTALRPEQPRVPVLHEAPNGARRSAVTCPCRIMTHTPGEPTRQLSGREVEGLRWQTTLHLPGACSQIHPSQVFIRGHPPVEFYRCTRPHSRPDRIPAVHTYAHTLVRWVAAGAKREPHIPVTVSGTQLNDSIDD